MTRRSFRNVLASLTYFVFARRLVPEAADNGIEIGRVARLRDWPRVLES